MKNISKFSIPVVILLMVVMTAPLFAAGPSGVAAKMNWMELATTFLYGLMGIVLSMVGYKVYDLMVPFDIHKEIAEDQNTSLGIVLAAIILGVSIIVAAAIAS
jgi:uncharacterized membrane protein YjfL (UPF0719 family)